MIRTVAQYSIVALAGLVAVKLVFKLLSFAFSLLMSVLWLVAILGLAYFVLKVIKAAMANGSPVTVTEEVEVEVEESGTGESEKESDD